MKLKKYLKNPFRLYTVFSSRGWCNWLPDRLHLTLEFRALVDRWPDLDNPKTFNEKIQWLKLYNRQSKYTMMVDKVAVRDYIAEKIGEEYLIPLLGGKFYDVAACIPDRDRIGHADPCRLIQIFYRDDLTYGASGHDRNRCVGIVFQSTPNKLLLHDLNGNCAGCDHVPRGILCSKVGQCAIDNEGKQDTQHGTIGKALFHSLVHDLNSNLG